MIQMLGQVTNLIMPKFIARKPKIKHGTYNKYGCRSCINNAESLTVNPEEVPYDWRPCFFCDICNNFDGESLENMEREECEEYMIDDYHARKNREKLRVVR